MAERLKKLRRPHRRQAEKDFQDHLVRMERAG